MSDDRMNIDDESPLSRKARSLESLIAAAAPLSSSLSRLSSSSRVLPAAKDFHFFYNFDEFKRPIDEISADSHSVLETIGSSAQVWGKPMRFGVGDGEIDGDDAYDWLVNVNDEIFERFDVSVDEFERIRKKEEQIGRPVAAESENDGFQMVYGKKKKPAVAAASRGGSVVNELAASGVGVRVAERGDTKVSGAAGKAKVPFHIPTIRKPQEEYSILVNNANQPFEHVWLERSEDAQRFIHPLEKYSVLDFLDKDIGDVEPIQPPSMEKTPFKLVEEVKDLKELAAKLKNINEFAVDLEHNQYRSFQGLTCLMQISTRTEDYIVDTLKLRIHVGPYLREVFKDPTKKKVMHGADRDILWLQRDFGIYVCNLFDTGQASRVMKLERNSLEFLLNHFCGVTANKEYQNADWRLRPLPDEMIRYAREDTHYLLFIYDVMKIQLQSMPKEDEHSDAPLVEVYKRSYDVCMQLYEKELLTEDSYSHIYGLQAANFNAVQLAIVSGLCEWRDVIARAEDESTGYILPNKTLLEIAKEMPVTAGKLRRLLRSKHPYIERNIGSVVSIIRQSMQNAAAFEHAARRLKEGRLATVAEQKQEANQEAGNDAGVETIVGGTAEDNTSMSVNSSASAQVKENSLCVQSVLTLRQDSSVLSGGSTVSVQSSKGTATAASLFSPPKVSAAVQVSKKASGGFGSLLGNAAAKRKFGIENKAKEDIKVERIRSSVSLPFHTFSNKDTPSKQVSETPSKVSQTRELEESDAEPASASKLDDIIMLENDSDSDEEAKNNNQETINHPQEAEERATGTQKPEKRPAPASGSNLDDIIVLGDNSDEEPGNHNTETTSAPTEDKSGGSSLEMDGEEPMSLSELSTNFQKCFKSMNDNKKSEKPMKPTGFMNLKPGFLNIKPFDYAAAKKEVKFGEEKKRDKGDERQKDSDGKKKSSGAGQAQKNVGAGEFSQGKRRQAFPASGNRSATFR